MKKIIMLLSCLIVFLAACGKGETDQADTLNATAPRIVIGEKSYYATELEIINKKGNGLMSNGVLKNNTKWLKSNLLSCVRQISHQQAARYIIGGLLLELIPQELEQISFIINLENNRIFC